MVEKLLDRSLDNDDVAVEAEGETKVGINDYLRSFKVATYVVKEGGEVGVDMIKYLAWPKMGRWSICPDNHD